MDKLLITIPFQGFYESIHNDILDDGLRSIFDYNDSIYDKAYGLINWQATRLNYVKEYIKAFCEYVSVNIMLENTHLELELESLSSPKEYNFSTDRIFCYITPENFKEIYKQIDENELRKLVKDKFTSRSGFFSFYSNTLDDWYKKPFTAWDHNELGTVLECLYNQNRPECECYIFDDCYSEIAVECLTPHEEDSKEYERLKKISYYLYKRENER